MSESIFAPELAPGTPGYDEFMRARGRAVSLPASHFASGATSLALTPGQDVQPGPVESYLPGIVTRLGGGLLGADDAAAKVLQNLTYKAYNAIRGAAGLPPETYEPVQTPPVVTRLGELGESTRKRAETLLNVPQPENAAEQVVADVGDQSGLMVTPIPGSLIAKAPAVAQKILSPVLHMVAPLAASHKIAPFVVGAGLTTAQDMAAIAEQNRQDEAAAAVQNGAQPGQPPQPTNTTTSQPVSPQQAPVTPETQQATTPAQPAVPTFSLVPPAAAATTRQTPQFSLVPPTAQTQQSGAPQFSLVPPTDQQQTGNTTSTTPQVGESGLSYPTMLAGAVALASPFLGLRFGRPYLERSGIIGPADRAPGTPYAAQKQAFENFQTNPDLSVKPGERPQAPLSVTPTSATAARVQAGVQDQTALLRAHVANTADTAGNDLAHEIGDVNNKSAQQARVDSYMETGLHKASGVQTVAPQEVALKHGNLNADGQTIVDQALLAQSELDHRTNMFNYAVRNNMTMPDGSPYTPEATRFAYRQTPDSDLRQAVRTAQVSPDTNDVVQGAWQMTRGNVDILRAMGYPTSVLDDILKNQPHYVPSMREDGTPVHVFGPRATDTSGGPLAPPGRAMDALMMHQDSLMKQIEQDTINRKIIDSDAQAKANDPNHAAMFSLKATPSGDFAPGSSEPSVVIPRAGGWETHLIHNNEIAQAMTAPPPVKASILQAIRNQFTRYTTGPGALATAMKFFPAVHGIVRGPYLQNLNTTPEMYANLLDRVAKQAGVPNNPVTRALGVDAWPGAGAMVVKRLYDRAQHAASNMLMPDAANPANQILRHSLGDASVDTLRQRLLNNYKNSLTYDWLSRGGANAGNYGQMLVGADQTSRGGQRIVHNPAAVLAPRAVQVKSPLGRVMPYTANLNNMVREVFDSFMEAPNMYSYALNRDNPNVTGSRLTNEARGLLGDPGKSGGSAAMKGVIRNLPYTNATTQDLARAARAKAEQPVTRMMARSIMLGTGAAASVYSAMHTPGGLSHLLNLVSTNQLASGPLLYNGTDTDNTTPINLPQSERAVYPIILDAVLHMTNAWNAHQDEPTFERMYHMLSDMHSAHIYNNTLTAAEHGASQQVDPFIGMSPAVSGIITGITGQEPRLQADRLIDRAIRGRPLELSAPVDSKSRTPNAAGEDSIFGAQEGKKLEGALSGIFGLGSDLLETVNRGYSSWKHGEDLSTSVGRMLDNMGQHFKDQNQTFNNILWDNSTKLSTSTPLVENTNKSLDVMRDAAGAKSDISFEGATRRGGVPLSGQADKKMETHDPVMQNMRIMTAAVLNNIDTKFMPHVTDIKKLDNDLNNVQMDEATRRAKHNEYVRQINEAYIPIAQQVAYLNENLSRLAGKRIDISQGRIDWTRGSDQFN